jgi:2-amino-4-hydroxy-6-hydroxymethyldihydropteridine diphosphokinase
MLHSGTFVLLSLGANLGDRVTALRSAVELLLFQAKLTSVRVSPLYETEPVGFKEQPHFLNSAVCGFTRLLPQEFHATTKRIEQEIGRKSRDKWHEREIDIDILLFGSEILDDNTLHLPHPRMNERRFVLIPSADIAPDAVHPISGKTVRMLLDECRDTADVRLFEEAIYLPTI